MILKKLNEKKMTHYLEIDWSYMLSSKIKNNKWHFNLHKFRTRKNQKYVSALTCTSLGHIKICKWMLKWMLKWILKWILKCMLKCILKWILKWLFKWVFKCILKWILKWIFKWLLKCILKLMLKWMLKCILKKILKRILKWMFKCILKWIQFVSKSQWFSLVKLQFVSKS